MLKQFQKIYSLTLIAMIFAFGLLFAFEAKANGSLEITFENDPLFQESNFLPGDHATGWIKVKNNTGQTKSISIWTDNEIDPNYLGDVLNLEIKEGGNTLYNDTLSHLFATSSIFLSSLANGNQTQYDLTITFDILAGNEYQDKTLQFDLSIGSGPSEEGGGTTLGVIIGGGVVVPITLEIFNVRTDDISQNGAIITWQTTLFSTSQVIYSAEDEGYEFELTNPPKYGYSHLFPDPEDSTLVTFHIVLLSGLKPCTTYYYRVVSHEPNRQPSISPEFNFKTLCLLEEGEKEEEKPLVILPAEEERPKEEIIPPVEAAPEEIEEKAGEEIAKEKPEERIAEEKPLPLLASLLAAIGNAFGDFWKLLTSSCLPWWLILIFAIYPLIRGITTLRKSKKETNLLLKSYFKREGVIWLISILIPIILAIWFFLIHYFCVAIWVFILSVLASFLGWWLDNKITRRKVKEVTGEKM